jgi:hypothetical protein
MRFDVVEWYIFSVQKCFKCSNLVPYGSCKLFRRHLDFAAPEALDVRQPWMSTNGDIVLLAC